MDSKPLSSPFTAMGETFEFMQKLWGGMGVPAPGNLASFGMPQQMPSMLAPTIDLGELDKRIADLRAVEKWMELNASMLRTTIQTLEVQRATIATLKGITGAMMAPMMASPPPAPRVNPLPSLPPELQAAPPAAEPPGAAPARRQARPRKATAAASPSLADDALNPAAWWQTLQDQFSRLAASAVETPAPTAKTPRKKARRAPR